jgi:hypothetical protein
MSNEIELYSKLNEQLGSVERMGTFFAKSGMFGCDRAEQGIVLAIECVAQRKTPSALLRRFDIVEGKLRPKAATILADFRALGGKHKWLSSGDAPAEKREDWFAEILLTPPPKDGQEPIKYRYSMADAEKEGLLRKGSRWEKRPGNMLRARCITNGVGMLCPEITAGDDDSDFEQPNAELKLPAEPAKANVIAVETVRQEEKLVEKLEQVKGQLETIRDNLPEKPAQEFKPGPAYSAPTGAKLPQDLVDQVEQALGEHGATASRWMMAQNPPWLTAGQSLADLTAARANRILKQRDSFIKAITSEPSQAAA